MRVRPTMKNVWVVHHYNAPYRKSKNIPEAFQPSSWPNLSPCGFLLFARLKNHLKGRHFRLLEDIKTAVTDHSSIRILVLL